MKRPELDRDLLLAALQRLTSDVTHEAVHEVLRGMTVPVRSQPEPQTEGGFQVILSQVDHDGNVLSSSPLELG